MPFDDLRAVNTGHGSASPDAGEGYEEQCAPTAGGGSGGESVGHGGVPGAGWRRVQIDRTRGWNHAVDERSEDATGASEDFGDMEGVSAGAAKRHIGGDVDVVCRDPGAAGRTSDLHEIGGIMP